MQVLRDMEVHREKIQEAKGEVVLIIVFLFSSCSAWIQNGLMTVVGVGVMAYLQVRPPHNYTASCNALLCFVSFSASTCSDAGADGWGNLSRYLILSCFYNLLCYPVSIVIRKYILEPQVLITWQLLHTQKLDFFNTELI